MYRIAMLPHGLYKNVKCKIKYNKHLRWHLIKNEKEPDGSIFVIIKGVKSKKKTIEVNKRK